MQTMLPGAVAALFGSRPMGTVKRAGMGAILFLSDVVFVEDMEEIEEALDESV